MVEKNVRKLKVGGKRFFPPTESIGAVQRKNLVSGNWFPFIHIV